MKNRILEKMGLLLKSRKTVPAVLAAAVIASTVCVNAALPVNAASYNYNLNDAKAALKMSLGIIPEEKKYDLNSDKTVNLTDAQLCLKAALGIIKIPYTEVNTEAKKPERIDLDSVPGYNKEPAAPMPKPTIPPNGIDIDIDDTEKNEESAFPYELYKTTVYNGYFGYFYDEAEESAAVDTANRAMYVYDEETGQPVRPLEYTDEFLNARKEAWDLIDSGQIPAGTDTSPYVWNKILPADAADNTVELAMFNMAFCGNDVIGFYESYNGRKYDADDVYYATDFKLGELDMGTWTAGGEKKQVKFRYYKPLIIPEAAYDEIPEDNPYTRAAAVEKDFEWLNNIRFERVSMKVVTKAGSLKCDIKTGKITDTDGSVYNLYEPGYYHGFYGYFTAMRGDIKGYAYCDNGVWKPHELPCGKNDADEDLLLLWEKENPGYDYMQLCLYGGCVGYIYDGVIREDGVIIHDGVISDFMPSKDYNFEFHAVSPAVEYLDMETCTGPVNYKCYFDEATSGNSEWGDETWEKWWYFNDYDKVFGTAVKPESFRTNHNILGRIIWKDIEAKNYRWDDY